MCRMEFLSTFTYKLLWSGTYGRNLRSRNLLPLVSEFAQLASTHDYKLITANAIYQILQVVQRRARFKACEIIRLRITTRYI
jgi:hypothetical protein